MSVKKRLPASSCWLLVLGFWPLALGLQSLAVFFRARYPSRLKFQRKKTPAAQAGAQKVKQGEIGACVYGIT
jgi:hypothetical protein